MSLSAFIRDYDRGDLKLTPSDHHVIIPNRDRPPASHALNLKNPARAAEWAKRYVEYALGRSAAGLAMEANVNMKRCQGRNEIYRFFIDLDFDVAGPEDAAGKMKRMPELLEAIQDAMVRLYGSLAHERIIFGRDYAATGMLKYHLHYPQIVTVAAKAVVALQYICDALIPNSAFSRDELDAAVDFAPARSSQVRVALCPKVKRNEGKVLLAGPDTIYYLLDTQLAIVPLTSASRSTYVDAITRANVAVYDDMLPISPSETILGLEWVAASAAGYTVGPRNEAVLCSDDLFPEVRERLAEMGIPVSLRRAAGKLMTLECDGPHVCPTDPEKSHNRENMFVTFSEAGVFAHCYCSPKKKILLEGMTVAEGAMSTVGYGAVAAAQTRMVDRSIFPPFDNATALISELYRVAALGPVEKMGLDWQNTLRDVFSMVSYGYENGVPVIYVKEKAHDMVGGGYHVQYLSIPRKEHTPLSSKEIFRIKRVSKDETESIQSISLNGLYPDESYYTVSVQSLGMWAGPRKSALNLSPAPNVQPARGPEFAYRAFKKAFIRYFDSVFLGNEDEERRPELREYILSWYAHALYGSGVGTQKLLVVAEPLGGIGKSALFSDISRMLTSWSPGYVRTVAGGFSRIATSFNDYAEGQRLLVIEEAETAVNTDSATVGALRDLVTAPSIEIRKKYKSPKTVANSMSVVLISNSGTSYLTSEDDRRVIVIAPASNAPDGGLAERQAAGSAWVQLMIDNLAAFGWYLTHDVPRWTTTFARRTIVTGEALKQGMFKTAVTASKILTAIAASLDEEPTLGMSIGHHIPASVTQDTILRFTVRDLAERARATPKQTRIEWARAKFNSSKHRERFVDVGGIQRRAVCFSCTAGQLEDATGLAIADDQ